MMEIVCQFLFLFRRQGGIRPSKHLVLEDPRVLLGLPPGKLLAKLLRRLQRELDETRPHLLRPNRVSIQRSPTEDQKPVGWKYVEKRGPMEEDIPQENTPRAGG